MKARKPASVRGGDEKRRTRNTSAVDQVHAATPPLIGQRRIACRTDREVGDRIVGNRGRRRLRADAWRHRTTTATAAARGEGHHDDPTSGDRAKSAKRSHE